MKRFEIKDNFYMDGAPFKIISGGIHYFRIVPEYWRDRLEKLKAMGCNTVETYVPWNMHEAKKGKYNFEGMLDIKKFIEIAQEIGLWVIVRPSPYICAEWEFGGLPGWLLAEEGMKLRCSYEPYLTHVEEYYNKLMPILKPLQITKGGPVILVQIENEYGYYGTDTKYLEALRDMMVDNGIEVPFVTSDGPWNGSIERGKVEGVLPTANFGSKTKEQFDVLKKSTDGPLMCMEFWVGWFDNWGVESHQRSDLEQSKKDLDIILESGNVNIYMFIGGTNFGFMNGSNYYDYLTPDVTSYDYDAVLTEDGQITKKYKDFQNIIRKYSEISEVELSTDIKRKSYGELKVFEKVSLFNAVEQLSEGVSSLCPMSMERLGQEYGYVLYRSWIKQEEKIEKLRLWDANDRANLFVDENPILNLYDRDLLEEQKLDINLEEESKIDILVENMGRVNFGSKLEYQRKGIDGGVQINGYYHYNWTIYPLPLDNLEKLDFLAGYQEGTPSFYKFKFQVDEIADTFLDFNGWGKGCAFLNGFNLGRFWEIGPQKRLYIPGPLLKKGENEIIMFETDGKIRETIELKDEPDLG